MAWEFLSCLQHKIALIEKNMEENRLLENQVDDLENVDLEINPNTQEIKSDVEEVYPAAEVRIEKAQFSILHLNILCNVRKDVIIDPDFQRNSVWTSSADSELIESILMGIPIPLIYLFEDQMGKRQVVDGRQRITAILKFLNNELTLSGLKILKKLNGKKFEAFLW